MGKTNRQLDARERARNARLRLDAERDKRDGLIEDAVAAYYTAGDEREDLVATLRDVEARMRATVRELIDLRETPTRVAALLGIEAREVRAIRKETAQDQITTRSAPDTADKDAAAGRPTKRVDAQGRNAPPVVHTAPDALGVDR
ncbi:hypothetical protein [Georgenia daeguensis]|uniref:DNA-binding protein n=1 Tax=Georgenia daeguensis TaxID=908355 RepID=A0ABP6UN27_9MICO